MPKEDLSAAIALLERRLVDHERKGNELRRMINFLYEEGGHPAKYADVDSATGTQGGGAIITQIKRDSFYGKKQMTAIREYLEMRRSQGDGPATPQEILDALKAGGYKFEAKSDEVALIGLRALLRKATAVFHKLPGTRAYGLLSWYPNAKPEAPTGGENDEARSKASRATSKKTPVKKRRLRLTGPDESTLSSVGDESEAA